MDGTDADDTTEFTYKGVSYKIDLSAANDKKFDKDMEKWINAAQRQGRSHKRIRVTAPQSRADNEAIREWAKRQGKTVSDRGRVPKDIVDAFNKDHEGSMFSSAGT
jgi:hypothetical protein